MQIRTGTYTGTGVAKSVTNLGITPDFVVVKAAAATHRAVWAATGQTALTQPITQGTHATNWANHITALFSDGFSVGTHDNVNKNGVTYRWMAMESQNDIAIKTWIGDGNDNRSIAGVGFQPDLMLAYLSTGSGPIHWKTATMPADMAIHLTTGPATPTNIIQAFEADGFQLGSGALNTDGWAFEALCIKSDAAKMKMLTWTGDGSVGRAINGAGFTPNFAMVKTRQNSGGVEVITRYESHSGALSYKGAPTSSPTTPSGPDESNNITAFLADGIELGSDIDVNNAVGWVYDALVVDAIVAEGGSAMSLPIIIA